MRLVKKIALVTGAGRGIGKAIALAFAREGADLVICARREHEILETCKEIQSLGQRCLPVKADVSKEEDVGLMVERALAEFGRIDILVNNAGGSSEPKPVKDTPFDDWNEVIAANLTGTFLCSKAVIPFMMEQKKGSIINLSSGMGKKGRPNRGPYCAAKFGIEGFTQVLALELEEFGIAVNALAPSGLVATERLKEKAYEELKRGGRILEPREVAEAAVFLATKDAKEMGGVTFDVAQWLLEKNAIKPPSP
ncbi:MAG: SDR family oxidoreductase [bacterium]|nr:SDR family oxidoreductase [bacterium]